MSEVSSMEAAEQYKSRVIEGQLHSSDSSLYPWIFCSQLGFHVQNFMDFSFHEFVSSLFEALWIFNYHNVLWKVLFWSCTIWKYHLLVLSLYNLMYKNLWSCITTNSRWPFPLCLLYAGEENFISVHHILFQLLFLCCLSLVICSSYHSHWKFLITLTIFSCAFAISPLCKNVHCI